MMAAILLRSERAMPRKRKPELEIPVTDPLDVMPLEAQIEALTVEVRALRNQMKASIGRHPLSKANDARLPKRKDAPTGPPQSRLRRRRG